MNDFEVRITPEPSDEDEAAILAAVRAVIEREADLAQPSAWRTAGWTAQRVGMDELRSSFPSHRRWALSTILPRGGRIFPGLYGRGDAK